MARPLPLKNTKLEPFFAQLVEDRKAGYTETTSVSKQQREPSPTKPPTYLQNGYHSPEEIL